MLLRLKDSDLVVQSVARGLEARELAVLLVGGERCGEIAVDRPVDLLFAPSLVSTFCL